MIVRICEKVSRKADVPLRERRWGRRKRKVVRSVADEPVLLETALGVHGRSRR
jgi:hypothetical protein